VTKKNPEPTAEQVSVEELPLMLRTGWVVVRRMTRVWPSVNSMARV
jgi:hypothetical protein